MLIECSAACPSNEKDSKNRYLGFQESVVLSRDAWTGRELVEERVQDITVPFANKPKTQAELRIDHCAYAPAKRRRGVLRKYRRVKLLAARGKKET